MKTAKHALWLLSLLAGIGMASASDEAKAPQPEKTTPAKNGEPAVQNDKAAVQNEKPVVQNGKAVVKNDKAADQTSGVVESIALTGSLIKSRVTRNGQITDGPELVLVLDQKTIANSGASDLRQLLTRQGVTH